MDDRDAGAASRLPPPPCRASSQSTICRALRRPDPRRVARDHLRYGRGGPCGRGLAHSSLPTRIRTHRHSTSRRRPRAQDQRTRHRFLLYAAGIRRVGAQVTRTRNDAREDGRPIDFDDSPTPQVPPAERLQLGARKLAGKAKYGEVAAPRTRRSHRSGHRRRYSQGCGSRGPTCRRAGHHAGTASESVGADDGGERSVPQGEAEDSNRGEDRRWLVSRRAPSVGPRRRSARDVNGDRKCPTYGD